MVTLNMRYGTEHKWDSELIESIWKSAAQQCWPTATDRYYICGAGVSVRSVVDMITEMIDFTGEEVLLIGRAPMVDGLLNELMAIASHDVNWCEGTRVEQVGWWRGCLIVRMLNWCLPPATRIRYQDGTVVDVNYFPQNELWLLPLAEARLGEAQLLFRYVDTSLPP